MHLEKVKIKNFRNIQNLEFFPEKQMNVICGENAQGKTNIIEAVWLFTGAKSFRENKDSSYIKFGEDSARCEIDFVNLGSKQSAAMTFGEKRTAYLDGKALSSPAKLAGNFSAIVFSPVDLSLIKEGPSLRRKFLDTAIGQIYPNFIEILKSYTRAVVQRNKIIKDYRYDSTLSVMLDVFEKEIADCGEKIIKYRKNYLERLIKYVPQIYFGLSSGREEITAVYVANCDGIIEEKLKQSRSSDMYTGVTSVGPHRDDIVFNINGISARGYGSQGQQRSVALALKLAGAEVTKEITGEYPVCLLDDVMSELDPARQDYILNHIKNWQSFITCCDPSNTQNLSSGKIITVRKGEIV